MSSTPNFDELKKDCNSDRLEHCYRFLFMQEAAENEGFITLIDEECDDARRRMQKRRLLLQEATTFSLFNSVSVDGQLCMREAQNKDSQILAALIGVLDLAREAREERRRHVVTMEKYG